MLTQYCLLEFTSLVDVQELASTQRKDHALIVLLQLIVDLCCHEGSELSLRERLIFVEGLAMTHVISSRSEGNNVAGRGMAVGKELLHLTDRARDFWPQQVDLLVQLMQGKRPQSWVGL